MTISKVPHPDVPAWLGEGSWTAPGDPVSDYVTWDTVNDEQPFRMAHNRDLIVNGGQVEQDYNFIDYWFGDPDQPVRARHYLSDWDVSIILPQHGEAALPVEQAKAAVPPNVLLYLQKRFGAIRVLADSGYETIWRL